ncbi:Rad7, putative isoform 4 [Hibiscus syriacus]|uniref:Rad7, putative isoform 4 n=1 Tax=Hibiscus syriacus TaxID=106335 RepID=A0A6A3BTR0_HIBSY|nr:Rad7, putative isoform 4 [Hibiscus syriacus]
MDAHFLQLLASGLPTEIRINDCSQVTEDEFIKIFGCCDTNNLTSVKIVVDPVLQLDLCGSCMPDYVLQDTLARSSKSLPALATLSLNGAHLMTDEGLNMLALSAPALQSINLSHSSLLTSAGINNLANYLESTLRELYLDECHNIEAMVVLPALKKLKCLEVLSMAGIPDYKSLRYLANGCRSINRLKLSRNRFSDEAIAAFLEASGSDLTELSLNNIALVGPNTALALSKCSRKLFSLDLSWCRNLNDEALGLIVDICSSLKQLKLFGCTQFDDICASANKDMFLIRDLFVFNAAHGCVPKRAFKSPGSDHWTGADNRIKISRCAQTPRTSTAVFACR